MVDRDGRWLVLYDADCGVCNWLLSGLLRWDRARRLRPLALQRPEAAELLADLPAERVASWHLVSPDGGRRSGGAALPELLRTLPAGRVPRRASPASHVTDRGYRWVAAHRFPALEAGPVGREGAGRRARPRPRAGRRRVELYAGIRSERAALRIHVAASGVGCVRC